MGISIPTLHIDFNLSRHTIEEPPTMTKPNSVTRFYDQLAGDYHLIFHSWEGAIQYQGNFLKGLIKSHLKEKKPTILDCSCGIGTQSIALASHGYRMTATDISPSEIERAKREARKRHLPIRFGVADFRKLTSQVPGSYDAVISFDNSLPHLLTDSDMRQAIRSIYHKLNPSGYLFASIRDYDAALKEKPKITPANEFRHGGMRRIIFQVWDWEKAGNWRMEHRKTQYRAWQRAEVTNLLKAQGFANVQWLMPKKTGFYQPIVIARKAA
jgi:glycine/sarcosine N-methyltransferase